MFRAPITSVGAGMAGSQGCLTSLQLMDRSLPFFVPPPSLLIQSSVARGFLILFLLREVPGFVGSWVSFVATLAMLAALSPASCILIYQTNNLWSLYMQALEEHTSQISVFGASGDQLQIPWEVNAQGCLSISWHRRFLTLSKQSISRCRYGLARNHKK